MTKFKILVCGGRRWYEEGGDTEKARDFIINSLHSLLKMPEKNEVHFISGMARGADQIPINILKEDNEWGGLIEFPADWNEHGKKAGPLRNIQMLEEGKPDLVVAFPDSQSRGTYHMIDISKKAGVRVEVYDLQD